MDVYLNTTFIVTFLLIFYKCSCGSFADAGFRTTKAVPKPLWSETALDKLKKDLLMNYDKYARPEQHYNTSGIRIGMALMHLETDEIKSTVTLHSWMRLVWTDPKLRWQEDDYGGISVARIGDHEIWQPDLYLYNSASGGEPITRFGNPNVLIYPNGEVLWVPPTKLTALCKFNFRYWPFDTQHCHVDVGSWTYHGNEVELTLYNDARFVELESSLEWSAWNVSNSTAGIIIKLFDCCSEPYHYAQFNLTLVRKSAPYKAVIVTPAIVIALLILMQFWLPPQAEERLILNGFIAITLTMFLIYFTNQISATGSDTPLIVLFYSSSLYMVCFSMIMTLAVLSLSKITRAQLPGVIRKPLQGRLGKCLLLNYSFKEISVNSHFLEQQKRKDSQVSEFGGRPSENYHAVDFSSAKQKEQDCMLALAVDRILFVLYSIALLFLLIVYLF